MFGNAISQDINSLSPVKSMAPYPWPDTIITINAETILHATEFQVFGLI